MGIVAGFARDGIAAVAGRAGQTDSVFAVVQLVESFGGAVLMHRLERAVTGHATVELRDRCGLCLNS